MHISFVFYLITFSFTAIFYRAQCEIVRPRIKFVSCLEAFVQNELVDQFYSSAIQGKTIASK